ncbi:MAG: ABC transporter permease [Chloroflexi bacterium]|nr:ABC transporter permease [Chloroflexota bacterium]
MSVIWYKVWRDLTQNRTRTLLVVLSIAVGVFALGLVFGLSAVMRARMTQDYQSTLPAHLAFGGSSFSQEIVEGIRRGPGVAEAEGVTQAMIRWKLPGETEWRRGNLVAREDYYVQQLDRMTLVDGAWPEGRALAIERQSARYFRIPSGSTVLVEVGRREREMPVQGVTRALGVTPPQFGGDATFYATADTVAWIAGMSAPNRLSVRMAAFDQQQAEVLAEDIEGRLARMGASVVGYRVMDPNVHPLHGLLDTLSVVLTVLSLLALGLSVFLIANTMSAIVLQQVWQIGVMKVLGATSRQVMRLYLGMALAYGLLALGVAWPLSVLTTHWVAGMLLRMINVDNGPFRIAFLPLVIEAVVALAVPALAALGPVMRGARTTPREAINTYGLGGQFGQGWLDQVIGRVRQLPRPVALSLRNSFRRKLRLVLTMLTLIIGGVMFITVMSIGSSLDSTLDTFINDFGMDVWVGFNEPERATRIVEVAQSVPGVALVEVWDQRTAKLGLANGEETDIFVMGLPGDSKLFAPRIARGRALLPGDSNAILLNNKIAVDEGLDVGDEIQLTIEGRASTWTVVGLIISVGNDQRDCFVPLAALTRAVGTVNRGTLAMVKAEQSGGAAERRLLRDLQQAYGEQRMAPSFVRGATEVREQNRAQFRVILSLMLVMALLAAVVGSLGLMGTMSINVMERSRELGVMRAIGATTMAVVGIFVTEGVLLGVLSWLFAVPISLPGARFFGQAVGVALLQVPLSFRYSVGGMLLWLAIVVILSVLASYWPARRAAQVRVVQVLRFE